MGKNQQNKPNNPNNHNNNLPHHNTTNGDIMNKKEKEEKLTPKEIRRQLQEQEAIMADYQDWIDRHHGDYNGDYWD